MNLNTFTTHDTLQDIQYSIVYEKYIGFIRYVPSKV